MLNHKPFNIIYSQDGNFICLSIVLVCWNNRKYLLDCLHSINSAKINYKYEVVVVDNGSTDGSQEMLLTFFPEVMLIQNTSNQGLSKASNQGIQVTQGRYVLLLNNDTIVNGESLNIMIDILEKKPKAGASGGTLLNEDGSIQATYGFFPSIIQEFLITSALGRTIWPNFPDHKIVTDIMEVDWLSSACLLLRRSVLDEIGLLDEDYFIYGDEMDLQYRMHKAGYKVIYIPQATTIHLGGRSMTHWARRKMAYRGRMLFFRKNYGNFKSFAQRALLFSLTVLKIPIWITIMIYNKDRAEKELKSNKDVLQLCMKLK
jgi:GT2 family glycosyltransferase